MQEATKLNAETRDPPSQDPRDHNERLHGMTLHPDTLKQTPTTPGHNKVVRRATAQLQCYATAPLCITNYCSMDSRRHGLGASELLQPPLQLVQLPELG